MLFTKLSFEHFPDDPIGLVSWGAVNPLHRSVWEHPTKAYFFYF